MHGKYVRKHVPFLSFRSVQKAGNWTERWRHGLPIAALEKAIAERQPPPGLVHHSDRGVQYASGDYVRVLSKHQMIPSMSRPANPYDNASCESFLKTLKREEIYPNRYRDLDDLRASFPPCGLISLTPGARFRKIARLEKADL